MIISVDPTTTDDDNMLSTTSAPSADPITVVIAARERGARLRPAVGGFPVLAESLRQAGIDAVHCDVASMTTLYRTGRDAVVDQQAPLVNGPARVADFDRDAVIAAIRRDQRGESTSPEFMVDIWRAGVITYDIDLAARTCTYLGVDPTTDVYVEDYPAITIDV
jgi:uncharacterized protein YbcV (DUF1398 family)